MAKEATAARHYQAIWLLAKGHTVPEVTETTSFGTRWLEQLLSRYNSRGPTALGDQRRHNGRAPSILKPELLERLKPRLATPPADGGLWTGPKVVLPVSRAEGSFLSCTECGENVDACPKCRRGWLQIRKGKHGPFLGCSEWPECSHTHNV